MSDKMQVKKPPILIRYIQQIGLIYMYYKLEQMSFNNKFTQNSRFCYDCLFSKNFHISHISPFNKTYLCCSVTFCWRSTCLMTVMFDELTCLFLINRLIKKNEIVCTHILYTIFLILNFKNNKNMSNFNIWTWNNSISKKKCLTKQ